MATDLTQAERDVAIMHAAHINERTAIVEAMATDLTQAERDVAIMHAAHINERTAIVEASLAAATLAEEAAYEKEAEALRLLSEHLRHRRAVAAAAALKAVQVAHAVWRERQMARLKAHDEVFTSEMACIGYQLAAFETIERRVRADCASVESSATLPSFPNPRS
jgi:hypothetical protein